MNDTIDRPPVEALARRGDGELPQPTQEIDLTLHPDTYAGMSTIPFTDEQAKILNRDLTADDVDIRPDGQVYMSHAKLRKRLNEAFRPGGWALRRLSSVNVSVATSAQAATNTEFVMSAEFGLYVGGRFVSAARGEQKYQDNGEMTYGDAAEGMKSNALSRCCKDLGIALDLWDRTYADKWRNEHAVQVWGKNYDGGNWKKPKWRALTALPFHGETGPTKGSPNQNRYVQPTPPAVAQREGQRAAQQVQQPPQPAPRDRQPGDDDDPGEPPAHHYDEPQRSAPAGNGGSNGGSFRTISDGMAKRLFAIGNGAGMDRNAYDAFLNRWNYTSDRDIRPADYDQMVDEARAYRPRA
jgi:hypothetical protein